MAPPKLPEGYLGAQPKFSEMKLKTDSHREANIKVSGDNDLKIKLKCGDPVKVTSRLYDITDGNTDLLQDLVLTERKDKDEVRFHLGFPKDGYYKFEIFAINEDSPTESLPNVYNYCIEVEKCGKPAKKFAKLYTKFYVDCCTIEEPKALSSDSKLDNVKFELVVPGAHKVAVHCGEEWFHLEKKGSRWEGKADLERYSGKDSKVTINASYEKDSTSYSVLVEYRI